MSRSRQSTCVHAAWLHAPTRTCSQGPVQTQKMPLLPDRGGQKVCAPSPLLCGAAVQRVLVRHRKPCTSYLCISPEWPSLSSADLPPHHWDEACRLQRGLWADSPCCIQHMQVHPALLEPAWHEIVLAAYKGDLVGKPVFFGSGGCLVRKNRGRIKREVSAMPCNENKVFKRQVSSTHAKAAQLARLGRCMDVAEAAPMRISGVSAHGQRQTLAGHANASPFLPQGTHDFARAELHPCTYLEAGCLVKTGPGRRLL